MITHEEGEGAKEGVSVASVVDTDVVLSVVVKLVLLLGTADGVFVISVLPVVVRLELMLGIVVELLELLCNNSQ